MGVGLIAKSTQAKSKKSILNVKIAHDRRKFWFDLKKCYHEKNKNTDQKVVLDIDF